MENAIDNFFSPPIMDLLRDVIGTGTLNKIKKRYIIKVGETDFHHIDLQELDSILREIVGKKTDRIMNEIISKFVKTKSIRGDMWFFSSDLVLATTVLNSLGDPLKKILLDSIGNDEKLALDLIDEINLPQATSYRRLKELLRDGILFSTGKHSEGEGRKAIIYETIFDDFEISSINNNLTVGLIMKAKFLKHSYVFQILANRIKIKK